MDFKPALGRFQHPSLSFKPVLKKRVLVIVFFFAFACFSVKKIKKPVLIKGRVLLAVPPKFPVFKTIKNSSRCFNAAHTEATTNISLPQLQGGKF
ncbi:hypothetical protein MFLO_14963 [Listeria floridensis FSL S10-1187]|uniref:Lipoprotein n=1 Tax=Listeria floridensis FSL S10-1187 TaxID=1265817 RepID=A0ABN0RBQ9_9LIST|nr:hypothetical protein MFLO_14963 [Listeria floridensis FSL S10-1187]